MAIAFGTAWYLPPTARSVSQGHVARQEVVAFDPSASAAVSLPT
jgi:hypothetical protein